MMTEGSVILRLDGDLLPFAIFNESGTLSPATAPDVRFSTSSSSEDVGTAGSGFMEGNRERSGKDLRTTGNRQRALRECRQEAAPKSDGQQDSWFTSRRRCQSAAWDNER